MADEKKILKMYNDLTLNNGQITKVHRLLIYTNIISQKGIKINANCN